MPWACGEKSGLMEGDYGKVYTAPLWSVVLVGIYIFYEHWSTKTFTMKDSKNWAVCCKIASMECIWTNWRGKFLRPSLLVRVKSGVKKGSPCAPFFGSVH
jgi:hypothetical protein